jgi:uncharacterized protein
MKLAGDYLFDATVPEVWSALFDPVILAAVMPGCEKLELVDGHYVGAIKVKVGPIQGNFDGKVDLKDKVEPESYTMIVDGRGAPGFVKATASVKLTAEGEGTRVFYDADAQVGGKIASVGQRLIEASARAIVAQSLEGLHTNIKLRAAAHRGPAEPAGPVQRAEATVPATVAAEAIDTASSGAGAGPDESGTAGSSAAPSAPTFTPVRTKQSQLANAVAKEVASTLFPRSVLVGIILIQAAVIVWLLLRH